LEPLAPVVAGPLSGKLASSHRAVRVKAAWALRQRVDVESPAGRDLMAYLDYKKDQPLGAFQWGMFCEDTGRADEALPWYEKALQWDPRLAPARHAWATALHRRGRSYDAVKVLVEGSELEPENPLHPYWLGLLYNEMNDAAAARDALRAAVARDATQGRFWYNLALAEARLGNTDAAFDALDEAERREPAEPHYPYTRATLHYELKQNDHAREALERVLSIDPNHAQALELMNSL